jgi:hypothetical protein
MHAQAPGLVPLQAGDGTLFYATRATLTKAPYFEAKLARWETGAVELDMDADSLRVLLTLLRYGPEAAPRLDPCVARKVAVDAQYLGIECPEFQPVALPGRGEIERALSERYSTCGGCCCHGVAPGHWECAECGHIAAYRQGETPENTQGAREMAHLVGRWCAGCGQVAYARSVGRRCVVCDELRRKKQSDCSF